MMESTFEICFMVSCYFVHDSKLLLPIELNKVPVGYYVRNGVLMRKWRPPNIPESEEWSVVHQIVVPKVYQSEILELAHESPMGGHLGINKDYSKITKHFYWPQIRHPKEIQSDQGLMSGLFQQVMFQLGAKQIKSSVYHPESQDALERFHSTLKNMIRTYCLDNKKDWDKGISLLLFAVR